jgi:hypothetical protein
VLSAKARSFTAAIAASLAIALGSFATLGLALSAADASSREKLPTHDDAAAERAAAERRVVQQRCMISLSRVATVLMSLPPV